MVRAFERGLAWAFTGAILGTVFLAFEWTWLMELSLLFGDYLKIALLLVMVIGLPWALLALAAELGSIRVRGAAAVPGRIAAMIIFAGILALALVPIRLLAIRPFNLYDTSVYLQALGVIVACFMASWLLSRWLLRRDGSLRGGALWPVGFMVSTLAIAWKASQMPEPRGNLAAARALTEPTGRKTLLLGVDGATWKVIDPLIARGELPNFQRFVDEGAWGVLESTVSPIQPFSNSASGGMRSPVLWSTVISGRPPRDHGILDMEVTFVPWLEEPLPFRVPYDSERFRYLPANGAMRRVKSLWQIFSEQGYTVGSVGWWPSWPLEDVNGFVISDRYRGGNEADGRVRPESLIDKYRLPERNRLFAAENVFVLCPGDSVGAGLVPSRVEKLFRIDNIAMEVGPEIVARESWDFLSVYVKGPDLVQHMFWEYHEEPRGGASRVRQLGLDPVEAVYRHVDDFLGAILGAVDEQTNIIMISDHGAGAWISDHSFVLSLWPNRPAREKWSGNHRVDGIFAMWGPDVRPGARLMDSMTLLDVAPTALYLAGAPVADDMPGRVIVEALRPEWVAARAITRVPSYEVEARRSRYHVDPGLDRDIAEELRSLGYLN